jgi:hypothetical protein
MGEERTCIDCQSQGPTVEPRWPGYGHKMFMRCEPCGEARMKRERGNIERNFDSTGFDPDDAGENFEEEGY